MPDGQARRDRVAVIDIDDRPRPVRGPTLLPALADLPGHLFWRARARVALAAESSLGEVVLQEYAVLLALAETTVPLSQQEIADRIAVSRTTVATVARSLVERGLIHRTRNPQDRRAYLLVLDDAGDEELRRTAARVDELEQELTSMFSQRQSRLFSQLLLALAEPELNPTTPQPLRGELCFLIPRVHQSLHREFAAELAPLGLEPRHIGTLKALHALGPVPQAELGAAIGISGASTVHIVDDLEAAGLLERVRPDSDRRTQVLHLLEEAGPTMDLALTRAAPILQRWAAPLSPTQLTSLLDLLRGFVTAP